MPITYFEEVLEGGTKEIDDHDVVVTLLSGPNHPRHAGATHESLVYFRLMLEWTVLVFYNRF